MDAPSAILIYIGISAVVSVFFMLFSEWRAKKTIENKELELIGVVQDMVKSAGQAVIETVNVSLMEQLDPILKLNSQAMSIMGKAGAATNQMKMMERQVMEAVNQQLPISPDMIEEFSPALAETLRKYPELMPKALQVYQKITGGGGDWGFTTPSSRGRPHPLREE